MMIKQLHDVPFADLNGYTKVKKQVVIGPDDGSDEIVMRYFTLAPGGSSPFHSHDWPHLVRIEQGSGVLLDAEKRPAPVSTGDYIFVESNSLHCFTNTSDAPFAFICIVPMRGES
ncbi:MAG: cupin domain-containing protein [Anaerolineae bacterium]|nr:cupin domain-containing protein [Anaerolineae bacterium]